MSLFLFVLKIYINNIFKKNVKIESLNVFFGEFRTTVVLFCILHNNFKFHRKYKKTISGCFHL